MSDPHQVNYWASFVYSYRNLHGLTQEQLSTRLGVSQQTVSRWEAGQQVPDPRSQAVLREVLGEADLNSKKNWIERVRRASGFEVLIDRNINLLSVSETAAGWADRPAEQILGKPYAKFLPADRPRHVEKAAAEGFFDGAISRMYSDTVINLGHATHHVQTDTWPVMTSDAGVLMHMVVSFTTGPQFPGLEGLKATNFVMEPNDLVGQ